MTDKPKVVGIRVSAGRLQKHSFWSFRMHRHAAGLTVTVEVAAQAAGARIEQIIVLGIDAE